MTPVIGKGEIQRLIPGKNTERHHERRNNNNKFSPVGIATSCVGVEPFDVNISLTGDALEADLSRPSEDDFPSSSAQLDQFEARLVESTAMLPGSADLEGLHSVSSLSSSSSGLRMGRFTRPVNRVRSSIQRQALLHADMISTVESAAELSRAAPFVPSSKFTSLPLYSSRAGSERRVAPVRRLGGRREMQSTLGVHPSKVAKEAISEEEMERRVEAQVDINSVRALPNQWDSDSDGDD